MKKLQSSLVLMIVLFMTNNLQGVGSVVVKELWINRDTIKPMNISKLKIVQALFSINISTEITSYGSKLIYDDNYLPPLDFTYLDYYATVEVYSPVVRLMGNLSLFKKNIKGTEISVNGESYSNYSFFKLDFLGLLNYNKYTRLVKNRLDSKLLENNKPVPNP